MHTWFNDGEYCVPEQATTTKQIFSLLAQLIAIQTAASRSCRSLQSCESFNRGLQGLTIRRAAPNSAFILDDWQQQMRGALPVVIDLVQHRFA